MEASFNKEKVLSALYKRLALVQDMKDSEYLSYVNYYKKKKRYYFFGDFLNDEEIKSILDGQHWFYGQQFGFINSIDALISFRHDDRISRVVRMVRVCENCDGDNVKLTQKEFDLIREFYDKNT